MNIIFSPTSWIQYTEWQKNDRKTAKKINELIRDIQKNGLLKRIGKPEFLKHAQAYSRRIDDTNRLVYREDINHNLVIVACKGHYDDK